MNSLEYFLEFTSIIWYRTLFCIIPIKLKDLCVKVKVKEDINFQLNACIMCISVNGIHRNCVKLNFQCGKNKGKIMWQVERLIDATCARVQHSSRIVILIHRYEIALLMEQVWPISIRKRENVCHENVSPNSEKQWQNQNCALHNRE